MLRIRSPRNSTCGLPNRSAGRITNKPEVGLVGVTWTYNAPPVDVASGSCPEVRFWSITLLARSLCGTCPRSRFLGSFTDHFDGLPTNRQSGFVNTAPLQRTNPRRQAWQSNIWRGRDNGLLQLRVLRVGLLVDGDVGV